MKQVKSEENKWGHDFVYILMKKQQNDQIYSLELHTPVESYEERQRDDQHRIKEKAGVCTGLRRVGWGTETQRLSKTFCFSSRLWVSCVPLVIVLYTVHI